MARTINANSWDASKILKDLSPERVEFLMRQIELRKMANNIMGRPVNEELLKFVEKKCKNV